MAVHLLLSGQDLSGAARTTAAVAALMAVWWITEAIPLPATSLLPVVLFPLFGVAQIQDATRPYASEIIFLFAGGFLIAQAVERWGLHRRLALRTVLVFGTRPRQLIGGFMLAAAALSMWISNTATAVMMLPIGTSVLALVGTRESGREGMPDAAWQPLNTALMLSIAYAASIGSVATIIGTPPNAILVGYLAGRGVQVGFGQWMLLGLPLAAVFLLLAWLLLTRVLFHLGQDELPGGRQTVRVELASMGRVTRGEQVTLATFVAIALLWVTRPWLQSLTGLHGLNDATIAIAGALALFLLPVNRQGEMALDWEHAKRIPWGILILFGGGLSLAAAIDATGLALFIGEQLSGLDYLALPILIAIVALVVVALTEVASNTATAAVLVPLLGGVAAGLGTDPLLLALPATLAATFAFMLPVATPPNAIVFSSGQVSVGQMARAGLLLNLVGAVLVTVTMLTLATWAFGPFTS